MPQYLSLHHTTRSPGALAVPGVYDGLSCALVQEAGFNTAFVSGAGLSFARFGKPDMGLVSLTELAESVAAMRDACSLSLIVDIDTGFGNALNVQRTVQLLERAGASGLQLEDQLAPKRCGHMAGKQVISQQEMVGKIRAALDARQNGNTWIIARTDAVGVNGFDDAMARAHAYVEAGADALFIEAPRTREQMQTISAQFAHRLPLVHNLVEGGNSPVHTVDALSELNYKIALFPVSILHQLLPAARQLLTHIRATGETASLSLANLSDINRLLAVEQYLSAAKRYGDEK